MSMRTARVCCRVVRRAALSQSVGRCPTPGHELSLDDYGNHDVVNAWVLLEEETTVA